MVAQGLRENTARASEMAHQWYADYKDGRGCLQRFSFRTLNAKRLWASCHSAFACKSSMRTLHQFSCAKSAVSTWCLATCRSTSPSMFRLLGCSEDMIFFTVPLSNRVGPSLLCSTRRTVLKAPAPRKLIDFKSANVTLVKPMTICCVWCETGKPNNEKRWKLASTKDTLVLRTTFYFSDWNCRILVFKDLTSVSSHFSICFIPCAPNILGWPNLISPAWNKAINHQS